MTSGRRRGRPGARRLDGARPDGTSKGEAQAVSRVTVVSNNPTTLRDLAAYLESAGIACHATSDAADPIQVAPPNATAVVIFPDDFEEALVVTLVRKLRRVRPRLLLLLVTRAPNDFRRATEADGRSLPPIVLPRPSFGWDIVDAIRAHAGAADRR